MRSNRLQRGHFRLAAMLALAGCAGSGADDAGFRQSYDAARSALEAGDYARAAERYGQLVAEAGPLAPRLRLEYAHALLRAGDHAAAAREAGALAAGQTGAGRAAALAVLGTAEHERARAAMAAGDFGPETEAALQAAARALGGALAIDAAIDPLGGMAARHAAIADELAQLRAYRAAGG